MNQKFDPRWSIEEAPAHGPHAFYAKVNGEPVCDPDTGEYAVFHFGDCRSEFEFKERFNRLKRSLSILAGMDKTSSTPIVISNDPC